MPEARLSALADGIYGQELERRIDEAANAIRSVLAQESKLASPRLAIVLGSGLGEVVELLDSEPRVRIAYGEIPNVPRGSVGGHAGELVAGGKPHGFLQSGSGKVRSRYRPIPAAAGRKTRIFMCHRRLPRSGPQARFAASAPTRSCGGMICATVESGARDMPCW